MSVLIGALEALALLFLPGAYLGFAVPDRGRGLAWRLAVSATLSPFLVYLGYLALRFAGASFPLTVHALAGLGLPALYLIHRRRAECRSGDCRTTRTDLLAFCVPLLALIVPWIAAGSNTTFWGHSFLHGDIVQQLVQGRVLPESTELAGLRHTYPWSGHALLAAMSFLLDLPPSGFAIWLNVLWMGCACWAVASLTGRFGGGRVARAASILGLAFAVNVIGYTLGATLPESIASKANVFGDWRYSPWMWGFRFVTQMPLGIALFALVLHTACTADDADAPPPRTDVALMGALAAALGFVYPILLPPAFAVLGWTPIVAFVSRRPAWKATLVRVGIALAIAAAAVLVHFAWQTAARTGGTGIEPAWPRRIGRRLVECTLVLGPLLLATWIAARARIKERDAPVLLAVLSGVTCIGAYILVHIPHYENEYKFIFTTAVCLAPFLGLALERAFTRLGRAVWPVGLLLAAIGVGPFVHKAHGFHVREVSFPEVGHDGPFYVLGPSEPLHAACEAIRAQTPIDTVLLFDHTEIHLPAMTQRSLYAPPEQDAKRPGLGLLSRGFLRDTQGYSGDLIDARRAEVVQLLAADDDGARGDALAAVQELRRPLAVIVDLERHQAAQKWLAARDDGSFLEVAGRYAVWFSRNP